MKEYIRKITKVAKRSYAVVIPKELIIELGWRERQKVVLSRRGKKIIVADWEK